tara:strand:+ start:69330 stop:70946 length:1617 start_codon:yes stop_codon:yes gene_type:complete
MGILGRGEDKSEYEVLIIGAGPVGLTMANLLGCYGVSTLLIEKNASTVSEPRAVSIDDESLRTMQAAGLGQEIIKDLMMDYGSDYISPKGTVFASVRPETREFGYPRRNGFHQPILEATLRKGLGRFKHVRVLFEHKLETLTQSDSGVKATIIDSSGKSREVLAQYAAACDGASSPIREKVLEIDLDGSTYDQKWIIVDLSETKNSYHHTQVYCDPYRPAISLPGPGGTRRFEFMMRPGESDEQALDPNRVSQMIQRIGPDAESERLRTTVYGFHARIAKNWQVGRISLHGDAAHLSPPFAGQGMNSGIRDAFNYAWKLSLVVKGQLPASILSSYEAERKPHAEKLINMAIRLGRVMMPRNKAQAVLTYLAFRLMSLYSPAKDYFIQMKYKPKPRFEKGFFLPDGKSKSTTLIGRMFPQPELEMSDGSSCLLDNLLGNDFALLYLSASGSTPISPVFLKSKSINIRQICIVPQESTLPESTRIKCLRDHKGQLSQIFDHYMDQVMLIRPDRYVALAMPQHTDIGEQIESLFSEQTNQP